ncbi:MAG: tol-pal system protein YbgF [Pseudomonadota bacterium]
MQNKLDRLENEIETLSRAVYRGEVSGGAAPSAEYTADLGPDAASKAKAEIRFQQMETELRELRGMLEEQNFQMKQLTKKLDAAMGDMQVRMSDLTNNTGPNAGAPQASSQPQDLQVRSALSNDNVEALTWKTKDQLDARTAAPTNNALDEKIPQTQGIDSNYQAKAQNVSKVAAAAEYESAFSFLKNSQYDRAAVGFDRFLKNHPQHALAANAKYWLGESHYVQGNFERASRIFAEGYKEFPKATKAPDNLLKLGMSLAGMGSAQDACTAFKQLRKEFSSGASSVLRRAEQEMQRLNCTS